MSIFINDFSKISDGGQRSFDPQLTFNRMSNRLNIMRRIISYQETSRKNGTFSTDEAMIKVKFWDLYWNITRDHVFRVEFIPRHTYRNKKKNCTFKFQDAVAKFDEEMDFVAILEYFQESMVLLSQSFCIPLRYMTSIPKKQRIQKVAWHI